MIDRTLTEHPMVFPPNHGDHDAVADGLENVCCRAVQPERGIKPQTRQPFTTPDSNTKQQRAPDIVQVSPTAAHDTITPTTTPCHTSGPAMVATFDLVRTAVGTYCNIVGDQMIRGGFSSFVAVATLHPGVCSGNFQDQESRASSGGKAIECQWPHIN